MKSVSLFKHVNDSLSPYRWAISLIIAVMVSGLVSVVTLVNRLDASRALAESLSPYLLTLVESSDRPELLRVLHSVSGSTQSKLVLVQDELVFATSGSVEELDRPFIKPKGKLSFLELSVGANEIVISTQVKSDVTIYIISPLIPSLLITSGVFVTVFFSSMVVSFFSARQMKRAIKRAVSPLGQLHAEIKGLVCEVGQDSTPIPIQELEEIRNTVRSTKLALENAKDQLAETKAKKLSLDAYKRLIHDLHNPVAALRQMTNLANDNTQDIETQTEAANSIPRLADQILSQVSAAKKNLEEEAVALRELNIIECVQEGIRQVQSLGTNKSLTTNFDSEVLSVPHDPALLKRAIVNLLENGIAAARSQVRVTVLKNNNQAFIRVCDDGAGMDENKVPVYLQGRGQSGKANRQAFGLSSANHIVRSHGGKLIYKRSDLGGSSFEIRLEV